MLTPFYFAEKGKSVLLTNDTGHFCFLSQSEFRDFVQGKPGLETEKRQELEAKQFLYSDSAEGYFRRNEEAVRNAGGYLFEATNLFILAVTNVCNNRCVYCQANGGSAAHHMSIATAEKALERIAESPAARITIEFQGGEPLINEEVIRFILKEDREILKGKEVQFTLVSNLSRMTEELAGLLREHQVSVSTSLDGPAFLHDRNRPAADGSSTFAATMKGCEILKRCGILPGAIETTTAFSLPYADQIVETYAELGFNQLFLRPLTRLGAAAAAWDRIGYTPEQFLAFYRKALERILKYNREGKRITEYHAALFLSKILRGKAANYMELRSPCGAGLGQMAITANGNVYTCDEGRMMAEMGDEAFRLGNVYENGYSEWIESGTCKAVCSASLLDTLPGCCDCVYKPYCGVCPVVNYAINGSITRNCRERCKIYKGILDTLFEYIQQNDPETMDLFGEWSEQV